MSQAMYVRAGSRPAPTHAAYVDTFRLLCHVHVHDTLYMYTTCIHALVHGTSVLASSIRLHVHARFMLRVVVHSRLL